MRNFEIFTDSSCDLSKEIVEQFDLHVMQLEVIVDDKPPVLNRDLGVKECYDLLRNGANIKTSAVTLGFFEEHMAAGPDVILRQTHDEIGAQGVAVVQRFKVPGV